MFHKIKSVAPLDDFVLLVHFISGEAKAYDMKPLIAEMDGYKQFQITPGLFSLASVDVGGCGVSWTEDIDIDGEELWHNGAPVDTPFNDLLSFSDATSLWGLNESTLRKAVAYKKLVEGVDAQKFGKQWVITRAAMEREYGSPTL